MHARSCQTSLNDLVGPRHRCGVRRAPGTRARLPRVDLHAARCGSNSTRGGSRSSARSRSSVMYRGVAIPGQRLDFLVEGRLIVEVKAVARDRADPRRAGAVVPEDDEAAAGAADQLPRAAAGARDPAGASLLSYSASLIRPHSSSIRARPACCSDSPRAAKRRSSSVKRRANLSSAWRSADSGSTPSFRDEVRDREQQVAHLLLDQPAVAFGRLAADGAGLGGQPVGRFPQFRHLLLDLGDDVGRRAPSRSRPRPRACPSRARAAARAATAARRPGSSSARPPSARRRARAPWPPPSAPAPRRRVFARSASPNTCGWRRTSLSAIDRTRVGHGELAPLRAHLRQQHALEDHVADLLAQRCDGRRGRSPRAPRRSPPARTGGASPASARGPTGSRPARAGGRRCPRGGRRPRRRCRA